MVNPLSLYIHLPFCRKKCPYCHFFVVKDDEEKKEALLQALLLEIQRYHPLIQSSSIKTLYFGGGTPSLFGADRLSQLIQALPLPRDIEITIEANPDDITFEKMAAFRKIGINRLSIGIQSLVDSELQLLGRLHTSSKAIESIHTAHRAGFDNISIDLMFETPDQTLTSWTQTLSHLKSLPINHLSLYNLTFEPGALFDKQKERWLTRCPSDEQAGQMLERALKQLEDVGLKRYEISAFAKPGYESKHNLGYWQARPFIGLGPSAFSFLEGKRFRNMCHFKGYIDAMKSGHSAIDFEEKLPFPDNLNELLAVELRVCQGVNLEGFEQKHGILPPETIEKLSHLRLEGYLEGSERMRLSSKGRLFYDHVASEII